MKIVFNYYNDATMTSATRAAPPIDITVFADMFDLTLEVSRYVDVYGKYYFNAAFQRIEVKEGSILASSFGRGKTVDAAIRNYVAQIKGTRLVYAAYTCDRREISAPERLTYNPPLPKKGKPSPKKKKARTVSGGRKNKRRS